MTHPCDSLDLDGHVDHGSCPRGPLQVGNTQKYGGGDKASCKLLVLKCFRKRKIVGAQLATFMQLGVVSKLKKYTPYPSIYMKFNNMWNLIILLRNAHIGGTPREKQGS